MPGRKLGLIKRRSASVIITAQPHSPHAAARKAAVAVRKDALRKARIAKLEARIAKLKMKK